MRSFSFALASLLAASLSACCSTMQPTATSSLLGRELPTVVRPRVPAAMRQLSIPSNSCCVLGVDPWLNRIYVSRTADPAGSNTTVVNGSSFAVVTTIGNYGGAHNADAKTHNFWLPGLYGGDVRIYSGKTDAPIADVSLGACPTDSWIDAKRRHAWIAAQCGFGNDPVWAVDADTYQDLSGWIGTGGVMGVTVVNSHTGNFYVNNTSGSYVIDPVKFKLVPTSFGIAYAANASKNLVYASVSSGLNIVDGNTEQVVKTVALTYAPNAIAVNQKLNHIYLGGGTNFIDVRNATTGASIKKITLPSGIAVASLSAHGILGRLYAGVEYGSNDYLYEFRDTP